MNSRAAHASQHSNEKCASWMLQTWLLCDVSLQLHLSLRLLSASHARIHDICINIWFWQIFKTGCWSSYELWWQVRTQLGHNVLRENLSKARKEGQENIKEMGHINYYIYRVKRRHMCPFQGGGRISLSQQTRVQTLQRISETAGQGLALAVNDGIIWKQSS